MAIKIYTKNNFVVVDNGVKVQYLSSSKTDFDPLGGGKYVLWNTDRPNESYSFSFADVTDEFGASIGGGTEAEIVEHLTSVAGFKGATTVSVDVVANDLATHEADNNNPHSVTKAQVGLSNVPNTDFTSAVNSNTAKVSFPEAPNDGQDYVRKSLGWSVASGGGSSFANIIIVKSLSDLPTVVGGKRTLVSNCLYWFDVTTLVLGSDYLEVPSGGNVAIRGNSSLTSVLVYTGTGAAIRGVDCNYSHSFITVSAPRMLEFTNTAKDKTLVVQNCAVVNQTSASIITGFETVVCQTINFKSNVGCFSFVNNNDMLLQTLNLNDSNTGTQINITPQSTTKILIFNTDFEVLTGSIGLNVTNTNVLFGKIDDCSFSGTAPITERLKGVNGNTANWIISARTNTGIGGYALLTLPGLLTTNSTNSATQPTYASTGGSQIIKSASSYVPNNTVVTVQLEVSVTHSASSNRLVYLNLYDRTTQSFVSGADFTVTIPTANTLVVYTNPTELTLTAGHVYEVVFARDSSNGNPSVTIYNANFIIKTY